MLSVLRRAPVVVLCLVLVGKPPVLAQAPAKGTEILWDRYGVPHIFAPDHPSLFYAYGYAQMEAHSELLLRLYAQARGRGAEFYGEQLPRPPTDGCEPTASLKRAKKWAAGQSAEFASADRVVRARVERLGGRAQGRPECRGAAACCRSASKTSTRTACGSSTTTGSSIRQSCRRDWRAPTSRRHGSNEWAIARVAVGDGQGDAAEQLAPRSGATCTPTSKCSSRRPASRRTARCGSVSRCCVSASPSTWAGRRRRTIRPSRICIAWC